jgi:CO/xanthine dehydrogenase Mo-binding subunit
VTWNDTGYQKTLEAARASEHMKVALKPNQGRGIASRYWHNAGGESSAAVNVTEDGMVTVAGGHPDIGGSRASMAMVVAEVLSIPFDHVRPVVGDTTAIGFSASTGRSRVAFAGEMAVTQGSRESDRGTEKARRDHVGDQRGRHRVEGWQRGPGRSQCRRLRAARSGRHCRALGPHRGPISAEVQINAQGQGPGFTTHICDVEVDPETGHVQILRYTAIQDVGRAIHPSYVEGQMQGGVAQGIGWALNEEYVYDQDGRLENPGFLDYRVPVCSDLPMIDAILIEVPNPRHPFGARGVGEVPIVPPMAAVANAIADATGLRLRDLPMSPPKLRAALDERDPPRMAAEYAANSPDGLGFAPSDGKLSKFRGSEGYGLTA